MTKKRRAENPELDALAAEAARGGLPPAPEPQPEPAPAASPEAAASADAPQVERIDAEGVRIVCRQIVAMLGVVVTTRAKVAPLRPDEVDGVGGALAQLAIAYDFGNLSPRAAAWLGLGFAMVAVAAPRMTEISARPKPDASAVGEVADPLPPDDRPSSVPGDPPAPSAMPDPTRDPRATALVA